MSQQKKYSVIDQKLGQMPPPDADALWGDMKRRLDTHLPEEKEDRRMFWWWRISGLFLVVPFALFLLAVVYLSVTNKHAAQQSNDRPDIPEVSAATVDPPLQQNSATSTPGISGSSGAAPRGGSAAAVAAKENETKVLQPASAIRYNVTASGTPAAQARKRSQPPVQQLRKEGNRMPRYHDIAQAVALQPTAGASYSYPAAVHPQRQPQEFRLQQAPTAQQAWQLPDNAQLPRSFFRKSIQLGVALNLNVPVSSQEMSTISMNGGSSKLVDYLPSLYGQYRFHRRWMVQAEVQAVMPQYTPQLTLASSITAAAGNQKKEQKVDLNKLYYLNLPVTLHYEVLPQLYAGAGLQYAYLTRSVLIEKEETWQKRGNEWELKTSTKKIHVKNNPEKEKAKMNRNNNNGPGNPAVPDPVDAVAQKLKSQDLRFTVDLSYYHRRFNAGLRVNRGINPYIDTEVGAVHTRVKDRNQAFQVYLRYRLWQKKF